MLNILPPSDRATNLRWPRVGVLLAALCAAVLSTAPPSFARTTTAAEKKAYVLAAPLEDLQAIGQHFVVGYHAIWQLEPLLQRGALGGVFVTDHNARRFKSARGLKNEIARIRSIGRKMRRRPLWIAVDQEGGLVSRLSPPLPRPIGLQNLIGSPAVRLSGNRSATIRSFAARKANALADLGVSINFAPVVDLRPNRRLRGDRNTLLRRRAIAADADTVATAAADYCAALIDNGVLCTLKHFPGLKAVKADTHVRGAILKTPVKDLEQTDWRPFRYVLNAAPAAVMVGHPTLLEIDPTQPVSTSKPVISGILREAWHYDGLVITDDLYMGAIRKRKGGMGQATVAALNAGADIVLFSRDASELYHVLYAALRAYQNGQLDRATLLKSQARLDTAAQLVLSNRKLAYLPQIPPPVANPERPPSSHRQEAAADVLRKLKPTR